MATKLYAIWFCPYAQRAWLALRHKKVEFEFIERDPYDKTPEWLAINPAGMVPAIVHNGEMINESSICVEFVDEMWPTAPKFLPSDPVKKAQTKMLCDFINANLCSAYYKLLQASEKDQPELRRKFLDNVKTVCSQMSSEGPFLMGKELSMPDIMWIPHAALYPCLDHYHGFKIPDEPPFDKFHKWMRHVQELDSVKGVLPDIKRIIARYDKRMMANFKKT